jgi:hypothetical protein
MGGHLPLWQEDAVGDRLAAASDDDPAVPLVFLPRGKLFEEALGGAVEAGRVTPELTAAFRDPVVAAARRYEVAVVVVVLYLMVAKPF